MFYGILYLPFFQIGQIIKEKRFVEAVNIKEYEYVAGDIPTEWEGKILLGQ